MAEKTKCWECGRELDLTVLSPDEEDYIKCPNCNEPVGVNAMKIKVVKVPEGPAPPKVREAWVGLELLAKATPLKGPEVDFTTREMIIRKPSIMVPRYGALKKLEQKSPEAADWFHIHFPHEMKHFTFGIDEIEVIDYITLNFLKFYGPWRWLSK